MSPNLPIWSPPLLIVQLMTQGCSQAKRGAKFSKESSFPYSRGEVSYQWPIAIRNTWQWVFNKTFSLWRTETTPINVNCCEKSPGRGRKGLQHPHRGLESPWLFTGLQVNSSRFNFSESSKIIQCNPVRCFLLQFLKKILKLATRKNKNSTIFI